MLAECAECECCLSVLNINAVWVLNVHVVDCCADCVATEALRGGNNLIHLWTCRAGNANTI